MKKLIVPSIQKYEVVSDFFTEFIEVNRAKNSFFSFRYFSNRIGWPSSYLSDLSKNRKKLSLKRAEEFSNHFKLSTLESERLIWLALASKVNKNLKNYANKKIKQTPLNILKPQKNVDSILKYHIACEVFTILMYSRKKLCAREIHEKYAVTGFSIEEIESSLRYIESLKILKWDENGCLIKSEGDLKGFDNFNKLDNEPFVGIEFHKKTVENFLEFINNPKLPSAYNSGFVEIKKDQFIPIAMKIIELRNWLLEISEQNQCELNSNEPRRLMQFNLDFFSLLK
jgi:uncharacterized protein (TIGR02147 family)